MIDPRTDELKGWNKTRPAEPDTDGMSRATFEALQLALLTAGSILGGMFAYELGGFAAAAVGMMAGAVAVTIGGTIVLGRLST